MNKVLLISVLFSFVFKTPVQTPKKVALIIQNTLFDDKDSKKLTTWQSLDAQNNNAAAVKSLLMAQNFPEKNIVVARNLTAEQFRNKIEGFIKTQVAPGVICVVYISSHGARIKDGNGDEQDLPGPKEDEVIICTDSPNEQIIESQRKTMARNSRSIDCHPKAIIDDEIGFWNDEIRSKIGPSGHYLLLADFCNSDGAGRGGEDEIITDLQTTAQPNLATTDALSVFLLIAASTKEIYVNPVQINPTDKVPRTGFYVKALYDSFDTLVYPISPKRTYQDFFDIFKTHLIKLGAFNDPKGKRTRSPINKKTQKSEDSGVPTLKEGHKGIDAQKLLLGGPVNKSD